MTEQNLPIAPAVEVEIEEIIPTEAVVEEIELDTDEVVEDTDDDDDDDEVTEDDETEND